MGRSPCCEKLGLKKGPWTPEEDQKLMACIEKHGCGSWRALPAKAGLKRCGKSCRLRWINYLRPDIKRGKFSLQEEQTIIQLHALLGNRWSAIATHLANRTDNEIKNYWNTHLRKRLTKMGIDPITHKPKTNIFGSSQLSHMAQWENARLEAEARLVRESKKQISNNNIHDFGSLANTRSAHHQLFNLRSRINNIVPLQAKVPPFLDVLKVWQDSNWIKPKITRDTSSSSVLDSVLTSMNNGSFDSPTSTNNLFMAPNNNIPGLVDNSCLVNAGSFMENPEVEIITKEEVQTDQVQINDISSINYMSITDQSSGFPSFIQGFTHLENIVGSCEDNLEDNKYSYWNTILNSCTSPAGSPVF